MSSLEVGEVRMRLQRHLATATAVMTGVVDGSGLADTDVDYSSDAGRPTSSSAQFSHRRDPPTRFRTSTTTHHAAARNAQLAAETISGGSRRKSRDFYMAAVRRVADAYDR